MSPEVRPVACPPAAPPLRRAGPGTPPAPALRRAGLGLAFAAALGAAAAACSSDDDDGADNAGPTGVAPGDPRYERDPSLDVELESRREGRASHEAGSNCMQCHQRYGPGPGQFSVAGTVYGEDGSPRPGATVRLLDAAGAVVIAIEADALGNFYSTAALPLPDVELFPRVESADARAANAMPFGTISGACNVCHTAALPVVLRPVP